MSIHTNIDGCWQLERGIELAAEDVHSLLILSGGQTRVGSHQSEGQSYYEAALVHSFWGHDGAAGRTTTEDYARDSYENTLFGIARFREATGNYPRRLTVVSWRFKEARFVHHALTVRWPISRFSYEGVGNPKGDALAPALVAEERTLQAFQRDPTGSTPGGILFEKRHKRNPYRRQHGYVVSSPELGDALVWHGLTKIPPHMIPWEVEEERDVDEFARLNY